MLARRGFLVDVLEKRPDLKQDLKPEGRSINLMLSVRGVAALQK
jgi:kynurenine 3-monooxygenase